MAIARWFRVLEYTNQLVTAPVTKSYRVVLNWLKSGGLNNRKQDASEVKSNSHNPKVDGADIHATDRIGWTALTYAVLQGRAEIVRLLMEAGAASSVEPTPH
jgi:ankyrin repeat protein